MTSRSTPGILNRGLETFSNGLAGILLICSTPGILNRGLETLTNVLRTTTTLLGSTPGILNRGLETVGRRELPREVV